MRYLYRRFFKSLPVRFIDPDDKLEILTEEEMYLIKRTERHAIAGSVLIELASYLLSYLPVYAYPDFFAPSNIELGGPFSHPDVHLAWIKTAWSMLVNLLQVYVLLMLNLVAVHSIAVATGYVRRDSPAARSQGLIRIAREIPYRGQNSYGIDPFAGMNHWLLYFYLLVNRFQGLIGNVLFKGFLGKIYGKEFSQFWQDFSGFPIYALIDIYSTWIILRNARISVMGQAAIENGVKHFQKISLNDEEQQLVYDSLEFIAMNKRNYNINHYYLTRAVIDHYGIPPQEKHQLSPDFMSKLGKARQQVADLCRLIIIFGFIGDGYLSRHERKQLSIMQHTGVLSVSTKTIDVYRKNFVNGRGLAPLIKEFPSLA
jgi:hypothetical protein